jgi:hypothetical protein
MKNEDVNVRVMRCVSNDQQQQPGQKAVSQAANKVVAVDTVKRMRSERMRMRMGVNVRREGRGKSG